MKKIYSAAFATICAAGIAMAAQEKFDGIVAVVGDEIVLQSELDAYSMLKLNAMNIPTDSMPDLKKYRTEFIKDLVDGKVLLVHAKQDTTISVSNEDVDRALENHINGILRQNNWTADSLDAQLKAQGMTIVKFKAETRKAIREQLLKQKVQQNYYASIKVNRRDVEDFYNQYKDSLPKAGESVVLRKLSMKVTPNDSSRQTAYEKIRSVYKKVQNGGDFQALARQYSESPEGATGGDLGFISKGSLSELAFEEKAFSLGQGEVSEPFETHLGFHIIKVTEKRDRMVHVYQIFVKVAPAEQQIQALTAKLDSIRTTAGTKEDFVAGVKKYSTDAATKPRDGGMGWTMLIELPAQVRTAIDSLKPGDISMPVREDNILSIYRVEDRAPNRTLTLNDDFAILEAKTKDILAQKKLIEMVGKWRQEIYVDVRL